MRKLWGTLALACVLGFASHAHASAETYRFEGLRFDAPDRLVEFNGRPRPDGPFLRLKNGERTDAFAEFIEVISGPESDLEGRMTRESFGETALMPASRFCGRHEVLRNSTRTAGDAYIVDVGYVCYEHSRQPQYSRQVVRAIGVFHDGKFTGFMFVRMWANRAHADDQLSAEEWMQPTDGLAASIAECEDC